TCNHVSQQAGEDLQQLQIRNSERPELNGGERQHSFHLSRNPDGNSANRLDPCGKAIKRRAGAVYVGTEEGFLVAEEPATRTLIIYVIRLEAMIAGPHRCKQGAIS